jgi:hypothetical protein
MDGAMLNFRTEFAATFSLPLGTWAGAVAFGILAGAAFGAAARYGESGAPYRFGVALAVSALPLTVLVLNYLFLAGLLPAIPGWLGFLFNDTGLATSALLLGAAGVAGLSSRGRT